MQASSITEGLNKVLFWNRDGVLLSTFTSTSSNRFSFSPNFQIIATVENDDQIKLWSRNGSLIRTIKLRYKSEMGVHTSSL
jgi:WD40 repeat protein